MHESVTYQMIVEEGIERGEISGMRSLLVEQGTDKFGPPSAYVSATIEQVTSPDRLRALGRALLHTSSWDELLASI